MFCTSLKEMRKQSRKTFQELFPRSTLHNWLVVPLLAVHPMTPNFPPFYLFWCHTVYVLWIVMPYFLLYCTALTWALDWPGLKCTVMNSIAQYYVHNATASEWVWVFAGRRGVVWMVKEASSCEENGIDWVSGTGWSSPQCQYPITPVVLLLRQYPSFQWYCHASTQLALVLQSWLVLPNQYPTNPGAFLLICSGKNV